MPEINHYSYSSEEVDQGLLDDLLNYLLDFNKKSTTKYYEIHISKQDDYTIVDVISCYYEHPEYTGHFEYVAEDQTIMDEMIFPDNSTMHVYPGTEDEVLKEWLEEHPGWVRTSYGTWTNEIDNQKFREALFKEKEERHSFEENGVPQPTDFTPSIKCEKVED